MMETRVITISNQYNANLRVYGTIEQVELLYKIAMSLRDGTFLEDMSVLLGNAVVPARQGVASGESLDTPSDPTPNPSIKYAPVDDSPLQPETSPKPPKRCLHSNSVYWSGLATMKCQDCGELFDAREG